MPQPRNLYLRVGLLVVVGLVLAIGFVLFFTASRFASRSATVYETYFRESVQGLEIGAPVRYRGVAVGRVASIGLAASEYRRPEGEPFVAAFRVVVVRFSVDTQRIGDVPSVDEAIKLGLRVRIAAQGITGVNYLELDFVSPERFPLSSEPWPWTPTYTYIPAIPSTVAQVQSAAERLLQELQEADLPGLVANVAGLAQDLRAELKDGDVSQTLREAQALLRGLNAAVGQADIPGTLAEVRGFATELRGAGSDVRSLLAGDEVRQALANVASASAALRTAAQRLPSSLTAIEQGVRTARGATTDLQADLVPILRDMRAAVSNLRDTTEMLRRNPSQAIFGAPPPAPREGGRR